MASTIELLTGPCHMPLPRMTRSGHGAATGKFAQSRSRPLPGPGR